MKRSFLLMLIFLAFTLSSCLEAEVDIDLRTNGSGEMRMKILPLESSMNFVINELEADLKKRQHFKDSDITRSKESDGRSSLYVRKKFGRVDEVDKNFKFISKEDSCEFQMIIPREDLEIVRKVTVNMPGQIIESNIKGFGGNSLIWNRTASSGNRLLVKSKPPAPFKNTILILIVIFLILGFGVFSTILIIKMRRKPKDVTETLNFCSECGSKAGTNDLFCQNCGQKIS
jgi:hypothetical protein